MKYSLQVEVSKVVKGLSTMRFTVKYWKEIAISNDRDALEKIGKNYYDYKIVERYPDESEAGE